MSNYPKYTGKEFFVNINDVETQVFPWGKLQWMNEPRITGCKKLTAGIVTLNPGSGHSQHNHPGADEIIYVISGSDCEQFIIDDKGNRFSQVMNAGDMVFIPADWDHGTVNRGSEPMVLLAVYEFAGSEAELAKLADRLDPPKNI